MKTLPESTIVLHFKMISILFAAFSVLIFLLVVIEAYTAKEWELYQKEYLAEIHTKLKLKNADTSEISIESGIDQIVLTDLNRIDRCTSCHRGINDDLMAEAEMPLRKHSHGLLLDHPADEFGCTLCHGGRGRALTTIDAHSDLHGEPFLQLSEAESNCGRCHLHVFHDNPDLDGMEKLHAGLNIFKTSGCLGCHKIRGIGGIIGPDLTDQGRKPLEAYDFSRIPGNKGITRWLKIHFVDPETISPGSQMVEFPLPDPDLAELTLFTRALFTPDLPVAYYSSEILSEFKQKRPILAGHEIYGMFCRACHGRAGQGRSFENDKFGVPHLNNQDFLSLASTEFIRFNILEGRGQRMMNSWDKIHSGLTRAEIENILIYVKSWHTAAPSFREIRLARVNSTEGKKLYEANCGFCHGVNGEGDVGPGLNRQAFLTLASDHFIYQTLVRGRANTAMPSWANLNAGQLAGIIKYLRLWQKEPFKKISYEKYSGNVSRGDSLYYYLCSRCHGISGMGGIGPAVLNPAFLETISDTFLVATLTFGREHSAMFGWQERARGPANLAPAAIFDIIAYMRFAANTPLASIVPGMDLGSVIPGGVLFRRYCAECHGLEGEGKKAPALNNQEFLNAAGNGYLMGTISLGRSETRMPSWGRGTKNFRQLAGSERHDLVSFIRNWQKINIPLR